MVAGMKVRSWGRASRSVGNKPVDFLLDSFLQEHPKAMPIFALSLLEYVSTFQKKQCLKICLILVLLASYWPTSKSHPKIAVRWRAFGCLRRPWNFDEDAGCMHQAHEIGIKRGASIFWAADGGCGCFLFLFGCLPDRLLCFGLRCLVLCCHVLGCLVFFVDCVCVSSRVCRHSRKHIGD